MKTKLLLFSLLTLALGGSLFAQQGQQGIASNPLGGDVTATSSNCATVQSCVWMRLPNNGSTATVTLAGTFSQTLLVELSGDGGNTWTTNATLSAVGITSVSVNGFTDLRVRCSAFTSGRASVTINVGILQVQSVVAGGSSSSSPFSKNVIDAGNAPYNVTTGIVVTDATVTNGSAVVVTSGTDPACTSAMQGQAIFATTANGGGNTFQSVVLTLTAGESTIASCTAHSITTGTTGNASASGAANGALTWGPIVDTQLLAAETAAWGATGICYPIQLPVGPMLVHNPHFVTSIACNPGIQSGQEPGAVVTGWGYKVSVIVPTPNFVFPCPSIGGKLSCFGMQAGTQYREFGISGEGNGQPTQPASLTYILSTTTDSEIWDLYISGWGGGNGAGNLRGIFLGTNGPYPITIDVDGAGSVPCTTGGFYIVLVGSFCGDSVGDELLVNGGQVRDFGSTYGCAGGTNANIRVSAGDYFAYGVTSLTCNSTANSYVLVDGTGSGFFDGLRWQGPSTPTTGCWVNSATAFFKLHNSRCIGSTNIVLRSSGQFVDDHDNSYAGGGAFNGTAPVPTTSGNGTIAVDGTTCFNERCDATITAGTTSGATPTITFTFAGAMTEGAGTDVPACFLTFSNLGTAAWNARASAIVSAKSTAAITWQLDNNAVALTAASTYKVTQECQRRF